MNTYNYDEIFKDIESRHGLEVLDLIHNLPLEKQRIAMLAAICYKKDSNLVKIINELKSSSRIAYLDSLIERIRKYNGIGDIEKKSFGEVFTPFSLIEEMLDTLPVEVWTNPNLKWGDFCNGIGNFMVIVIKRLMIGLKEWENDDDLRYKHIVENMIYVGELQEKNMFLWMVSINPKSEFKLNLFRGNALGAEFDEHMKNEWKVLKFNVLVGNPPYQISDGGAKASSKPLYNIFTEKYIKMSNIVLLITPSRWFAGGKGLAQFRTMMIQSNKIELIKHFDDATQFFGKGVEIKGGVSYFLFNNNYSGDVLFNNFKYKLNTFDIILNNVSAIPLLSKLIILNNIGSICSSCNYFGIDYREGRGDRIKNNKLSDDFIKVFVSKPKGFEKWIEIKYLDNIDLSKYRVVTPRALTKGQEGFGNIFISKPNECLSDAYISFPFNTENEAKYMVSYLKTKFVSYFLSIRKISQDIKPDTLKWIPIVPFDRDWTDNKLYEYFNLNQEEIDLIEKSELKNF